MLHCCRIVQSLTNSCEIILNSIDDKLNEQEPLFQPDDKDDNFIGEEEQQEKTKVCIKRYFNH